MKVGSLCTRYGGLDLAVEAFFGAETIWCAEFDKYASQVIEQRFNIPNYGNIKEIDWASLPQINILTAGYPCQPFSHAGQRKGTEDARHIYPYIKEAIGILRPSVVVLENVRGHLSLGLKEVLKDLASIGYDAKWTTVRASDVGAPHRRERVFIVATPECTDSNCQRCSLEPDNRRAFWNKGQSQSQPSELVQAAIAYSNDNRHEAGISSRQQETQPSIEGSQAFTFNSAIELKSSNSSMQRMGREFVARCDMHLQDLPSALDQDEKLNPKFVEYMMGLPPGWVTDLDLSRAQQLKILGNGVVPQQALLALNILTEPTRALNRGFTNELD